jgi:hypothetical protein
MFPLMFCNLGTRNTRHPCSEIAGYQKAPAQGLRRLPYYRGHPILRLRLSAPSLA